MSLYAIKRRQVPCVRYCLCADIRGAGPRIPEYYRPLRLAYIARARISVLGLRCEFFHRNLYRRAKSRGTYVVLDAEKFHPSASCDIARLSEMRIKLRTDPHRVNVSALCQEDDRCSLSCFCAGRELGELSTRSRSSGVGKLSNGAICNCGALHFKKTLLGTSPKEKIESSARDSEWLCTFKTETLERLESILA